MTAAAILGNLGSVIIVLGVAIVVFQTAKTWSKRRVPELDPNAPKPNIAYSGIVVLGIGVLMVAASASLSP